MKLVIQRVKEAKVEVDNLTIERINQGLLVLIGINSNDTKNNADYLANKLCNLRIFSDQKKKMNLGIKDVNGELLIVSQFTLYADCLRGNRPSFINSAKSDKAKILYEYFCNKCKEQDIKVKQGIFGANMEVFLINDGPVTIILEN